MDPLIARLDSFLRAHHPATYHSLLPGLTSVQVSALELASGLSFPDTMRSLYLWRNGQALGGTPLFDTYYWLSGEAVLHARQGLPELFKLRGLDQTSSVLAGLVPFAESSGGDLFCLDTAANFSGLPGQVVETWQDIYHGDHVTVVNSSFAKWLETFVIGLETGLLEEDAKEDLEQSPLDAIRAKIDPGFPRPAEVGQRMRQL